MTIFDRRGLRSLFPEYMHPEPCKGVCMDDDQQERWGILVREHHHPTRSPATTSAYRAGKFLLFDSDKDLVLGWQWESGYDDFRLRYVSMPTPTEHLLRTGANGLLRTGGNSRAHQGWSDAWDAQNGARDRLDEEEEQDWTGMNDYREYMLVTHWQTTGVLKHVSDEEVEAAKASILREARS